MAELEDYRPLDDREILNLVDQNVRTSTGYYDSELSRERKKVTDYYNGVLPARPTKATAATFTRRIRLRRKYEGGTA